MADKIKFQTIPGGASPGIYRHPSGKYVRDFYAETPPFTCSREEWESYLYPSGLFELVEKTRTVGVGDTGKAKDK